MAQKTRKLHKKKKNKTKLCDDKIVHLAYYILIKKYFRGSFCWNVPNVPIVLQ